MQNFNEHYFGHFKTINKKYAIQKRGKRIGDIFFLIKKIHPPLLLNLKMIMIKKPNKYYQEQYPKNVQSTEKSKYHLIVHLI